MATRSDFNEFFNGYVDCALWSSTDDSEDSGGEPLDANYGKSDIDKKALRDWKKDCVAFMRWEKSDLKKFMDETGVGWGSCGHDFWLTRNGHGAGFWDGDWPSKLGQFLTKASKVYGSCEIESSPDGVFLTH